MDYINAIIFGIIQGVTEFLPISSSGHLVILHKFITLPIRSELAFDVMLHLATLVAVVWFFKKEVWQLLKSWLRSFKGEKDQFSKLSWLIILGTIPAALLGFLFEEVIESSLRSPIVVMSTLIIIGILFIISEKYSSKRDDLDSLSWFKVIFVVGLLQALALIPGTSRSGITIIAGLAVGLKREVAVKFSFLLSIPIIAGAVVKKVPLIFGANFTNNELIVTLLAFIISLAAALLTIKYFLRLAKHHSLRIFAVYRFILAALIFILFLF